MVCISVTFVLYYDNNDCQTKKKSQLSRLKSYKPQKNWTATYIHITVPYWWNSISIAWLKKLWQFSFIWTITQLTPQKEKWDNHQTHKGTNEIPKISTNKISVLKRSNTFCSTFLKNFRSYLWTSYYVRETFQIHHPTIFKLA